MDGLLNLLKKNDLIYQTYLWINKKLDLRENVIKGTYCFIRWLGLMKYFPSSFDIKYDIWYDIKTGYIVAVNGAPLKCKKCNHNKFIQKNTYGGEHGIEEFDEACAKCGYVNAHWSFGSYTI